jgi:DNA invertase Pin-like site-specific DNA recombinase
MADAHRRSLDVVAVWKFDRFARSVSHLVQALGTFNSLGVDFVSLSEQIDTGTPAGKMVFAVLAAVAEFERDLIRERICAGIRNARAKGKKLGRPQGSKLDTRRIASLRGQGKSIRTIALETGISSSGVHKIIAELARVNPLASESLLMT